MDAVGSECCGLLVAGAVALIRLGARWVGGSDCDAAVFWAGWNGTKGGLRAGGAAAMMMPEQYVWVSLCKVP